MQNKQISIIYIYIKMKNELLELKSKLQFDTNDILNIQTNQKN